MAADFDELEPFPMSSLARDPVVAAPTLLDSYLRATIDAHTVVLRITEVEAYRGVGEDPGSHAYRGKTLRNASMFGPVGRLYVYRSYGIHWCANIVAKSPGRAGGILLRAGEVVEGQDIAYRRRSAAGVVRSFRDLARGPGRLASALGLTGADDGREIGAGGDLEIRRSTHTVEKEVVRTTRTGVAGEGGYLPARFFLAGDGFVSPHRPTAPAESK